MYKWKKRLATFSCPDDESDYTRFTCVSIDIRRCFFKLELGSIEEEDICACDAIRH